MKKNGAAPPWSDDFGWRRVNDALSTLAKVSAAFSRLCPVTCSRCPDPCCLGAKVWFDLRDLIFLHLTERTPPPAQPIAALTEVCRYLGPNGRRLDRFYRPWICTWYLCPTQTARLRRDGDPADVIGAINAAKSLRKTMARAFLAEAGRDLDCLGIQRGRISHSAA